MRNSLNQPGAPATELADGGSQVSLVVPSEPGLRAEIAAEAASRIAEGGEGMAVAPERLEALAEAMIADGRLAVEHKGFGIIMLANAANAETYGRTPFARRLLMLPRCLARDPQVAALKARAEQLGYQVLHADGTPAVIRVLAAGGVDAICGVACMDSLRRVFSTVRRLGAPSVAVPLLADGCRETGFDADMLLRCLELTGGHTMIETVKPGGYLALLQLAGRIFDETNLDAMIARTLGYVGERPGDPTHRAAMTWLATGGKRLRPFITLAAAAAAGGCRADDLDERLHAAAVAIEAFHKASLAHDDIEDGDASRYGRPALHVRYGQAQAINIGDYLLGVGYALACSAAGDLAAAATTILSAAHAHLALGQGEELSRRGDGATRPDRNDILRIYALKTSPAFEAALRLGLLLGSGAAPDELSDRNITLFCRHVGVAFQLLNDIDDLEDDRDAHRATYPLALRAEGIERGEAHRRTGEMIAALRQRALRCADAIAPEAAGQLCRFLAELVLDNNGDL